MFRPPGECPVCGTHVRRGTSACPVCGADALSGWKQDKLHQDLDLPDDSFDYESFLEEEFGSPKKSSPTKKLWWWTALILLLLLLLLGLGGYSLLPG
ncbi:MAG: hypothetical protein HC904_09870 [Blastochloris sp.]|nr:hypothetical protein [Blastochloris sp.]